jgi:ABC-type multidrug transport system fused ATPase/permease subunit
MAYNSQSSEFTNQVNLLRPTFRQVIAFIISILIKEKALLLSSVILLIVSSLAMVFTPWLIGKLIDQLTLRSEGLKPIYFLVALYALSELVRLIASGLHGFMIARLGQRSLHGLRVKVFAHIECLPMSLHDRAKTGELLSFITNDVQALSDMFSTAFMAVVEKMFVVIFTGVSLYLLSPKLALLGFGFFILLFIFAAIFTQFLKALYTEVREANGNFASVLSEHVEGSAIIRLNALESYRGKVFASANERLRKAQLGPVKIHGVFHPLVTLGNALSVSLLAVYGGGMVVRGEISVGMLITAFSYVLWLFWPVLIIVDRWNIFLNGFSAAERLLGLSGLQVEPQSDSQLSEHIVKGEIVFEDVWFAYSESQWVIKGLSMRIPAGKRVAFFGATGSGKTTLTSLLLRLYSPQKGRILLDGIDIQTIPLNVLRGIFGIVQQDVFLFEGSSQDNITLFSEKSISYGTASIDTSQELSMGERQLIGFERASFHQPKLWILDEATAHLDPTLDRDLEKKLLAIAQNKTVIIIAHRMSSLSIVDIIFVLANGNLLEQGSHQELVIKNGFYAGYCQILREEQEAFGL